MPLKPFKSGIWWACSPSLLYFGECLSFKQTRHGPVVHVCLGRHVWVTLMHQASHMCGKQPKNFRQADSGGSKTTCNSEPGVGWAGAFQRCSRLSYYHKHSCSSIPLRWDPGCFVSFCVGMAGTLTSFALWKKALSTSSCQLCFTTGLAVLFASSFAFWHWDLLVGSTQQAAQKHFSCMLQIRLAWAGSLL